MCFAIDAAMDMVNMSIELVEETGDSSYYMNSMKLHKLLYLSQCAMLKITVTRCFGIRSEPASAVLTWKALIKLPPNEASI